MTMPRHTQVRVAGVPWPAYKLAALLIGLIALVTVAVATGSAAPAVLSAAGLATAVWLVGPLHRR